MDIVPFDLQRLIIGDFPPLFLLEIVFRTAFIYLFTLFAIRLLGKRGMGEITPFELIVIVGLGSAVGDAMFYDDVPLVHAVLVISVVVVMHKILNNLTNAHSKLEQMVEGKTVQIIKNGELIESAIKESGFSMQEIFMLLRTDKIKNIGEVEYAYLEPSGLISIFKYPEKNIKNGRSILPNTKA